jgi:hypothetical protein
MFFLQSLPAYGDRISPEPDRRSFTTILHGFHSLFTGIFHQDSGRDLNFRFLFHAGVYLNQFLIVIDFIGIPSY